MKQKRKFGADKKYQLATSLFFVTHSCSKQKDEAIDSSSFLEIMFLLQLWFRTIGSLGVVWYTLLCFFSYRGQNVSFLNSTQKRLWCSGIENAIQTNLYEKINKCIKDIQNSIRMKYVHDRSTFSIRIKAKKISRLNCGFQREQVNYIMYKQYSLIIKMS